MKDQLGHLEGEVTQSYLARVTVAEKWTSCVGACVLCICITVLVLGLLGLLHHG